MNKTYKRNQNNTTFQNICAGQKKLNIQLCGAVKESTLAGGFKWETLEY